jgi:hypothetical protein
VPIINGIRLLLQRLLVDGGMMAPYILLKLAVTTIRIGFAILQFIQRYFQYETDWQKAWGRWTREYTIGSSIGSPDIRVSVLLLRRKSLRFYLFLF